MPSLALHSQPTQLFEESCLGSALSTVSKCHQGSTLYSVGPAWRQPLSLLSRVEKLPNTMDDVMAKYNNALALLLEPGRLARDSGPYKLLRAHLSFSLSFFSCFFSPRICGFLAAVLTASNIDRL